MLLEDQLGFNTDYDEYANEQEENQVIQEEEEEEEEEPTNFQFHSTYDNDESQSDSEDPKSTGS